MANAREGPESTTTRMEEQNIRELRWTSNSAELNRLLDSDVLGSIIKKYFQVPACVCIRNIGGEVLKVRRTRDTKSAFLDTFKAGGYGIAGIGLISVAAVGLERKANSELVSILSSKPGDIIIGKDEEISLRKDARLILCDGHRRAAVLSDPTVRKRTPYPMTHVWFRRDGAPMMTSDCIAIGCWLNMHSKVIVNMTIEDKIYTIVSLIRSIIRDEYQNAAQLTRDDQRLLKILTGKYSKTMVKEVQRICCSRGVSHGGGQDLWSQYYCRISAGALQYGEQFELILSRLSNIENIRMLCSHELWNIHDVFRLTYLLDQLQNLFPPKSTFVRMNDSVKVRRDLGKIRTILRRLIHLSDLVHEKFSSSKRRSFSSVLRSVFIFEPSGSPVELRKFVSDWVKATGAGSLLDDDKWEISLNDFKKRASELKIPSIIDHVLSKQSLPSNETPTLSAITQNCSPGNAQAPGMDEEEKNEQRSKKIILEPWRARVKIQAPKMDDEEKNVNQPKNHMLEPWRAQVNMEFKPQSKHASSPKVGLLHLPLKENLQLIELNSLRRAHAEEISAYNDLMNLTMRSNNTWTLYSVCGVPQYSSDVSSLRRGRWVSDAIVFAYGRKIVSDKQDQIILDPQMLTMMLRKKSINQDPVYDFENVRHWNIDFPETVGLIFMPLHRGDHWTLTVADTKERRFLHYDPDNKYECTDDFVLSCRRWLADFVRETSLPKHLSESYGNILNWALIDSDPSWPQQADGSSCGVYVMNAIYCISNNFKPNVTAERIQETRIKITCFLFPPHVVSELVTRNGIHQYDVKNKFCNVGLSQASKAQPQLKKVFQQSVQQNPAPKLLKLSDDKVLNRKRCFDNTTVEQERSHHVTHSPKADIDVSQKDNGRISEKLDLENEYSHGDTSTSFQLTRNETAMPTEPMPLARTTITESISESNKRRRVTEASASTTVMYRPIRSCSFSIAPGNAAGICSHRSTSVHVYSFGNKFDLLIQNLFGINDLEELKVCEKIIQVPMPSMMATGTGLQDFELKLKRPTLRLLGIRSCYGTTEKISSVNQIVACKLLLNACLLKNLPELCIHESFVWDMNVRILNDLEKRRLELQLMGINVLPGLFYLSDPRRDTWMDKLCSRMKKSEAYKALLNVRLLFFRMEKRYQYLDGSSESKSNHDSKQKTFLTFSSNIIHADTGVDPLQLMEVFIMLYSNFMKPGTTMLPVDQSSFFENVLRPTSELTFERPPYKKRLMAFNSRPSGMHSQKQNKHNTAVPSYICIVTGNQSSEIFYHADSHILRKHNVRRHYESIEDDCLKSIHIPPWSLAILDGNLVTKNVLSSSKKTKTHLRAVMEIS